MKILVLNYEFPPLGGGAANATSHLMREFTMMPEFSFDVVVSSVGGQSVELSSENVRIHFLDIGKKGSLHYQTYRDLLAYSWKAYRYSKDLLSREPFDLCHAFFGIPCGYIAMKLGIPYIVSLRGSDVPFFNQRFSLADRLLFSRMSVKIWRRARRVVANSKGLKNLALETSPNQAIKVIPNGIDVDAFAPGAGSGKGLRVVCVARMISRKRIDLLIRAMAELRDVDVSLGLVGTGNQESDLKALAEEIGVADRVEYKGLVDHSDMPSFYRSGDLFVLPSINEGMSNTVLEAMASGLPILMNNTGGAAELLEDDVNGFLLEKDSVSDIAGKIRRFVGNPDLLRRLGIESRRKAENLSWKSTAEQYARIYNEICATDRGGKTN